MSSDSGIRQIDELVNEFEVAMLITESLDGDLRGRPMAIAGHDKGSVLYFLTRADDEKMQEILARPSISVVMQKEGQYLSISGRARVETDLSLIDQHWSAAARLWFPDGKNDVEATLVIVEPTYAECWDRTGVRLLEFWWEAGKALLTGEKAADSTLSGHHKVKVS